MDQQATWYRGRPRPLPHCVTWGPTPSPKRAHPNFWSVCCGRNFAGWTKIPLGTDVDLGPGNIVLHGTPASPPPNGYTHPSIFPHVCSGQTVGWSKMPLATEVDHGPGHIGYWTTRGYANSWIANSRTGRLADWTSRGLVNSRTRQLAY